jgi:hypothetical protein
VKAAQARPSIFPILEVFKDLLELKLVLNLNEYTTPTQKPRQLLVGTAHMLAAAGAGEQFESGWEAAYPAVVKSYNYASMNCTSLKHTLQEIGVMWLHTILQTFPIIGIQPLSIMGSQTLRPLPIGKSREFGVFQVMG